MLLILKWFVFSFAIIITGYLIPGIVVSSLWTALILVLVFGFFNFTLKPILIFLTLPVNVLTLGLFTFIINATIIMLASTIVKGFYVESFLSAIFFSILLTIIRTVFETILIRGINSKHNY